MKSKCMVHLAHVHINEAVCYDIEGLFDIFDDRLSNRFNRWLVGRQVIDIGGHTFIADKEFRAFLVDILPVD